VALYSLPTLILAQVNWKVFVRSKEPFIRRLKGSQSIVTNTRELVSTQFFASTSRLILPCKQRTGETSMGVDLTGKQVLVLSDNDGLARAIELNLRSLWAVVRRAPSGAGQPGSPSEAGDFDLIVVAMSSPGSDLYVALTSASLDRHIGQVPMLIISEEQFHAAPNDRMVHLDFPFEIDELYDKVRETLQEQPIAHSQTSMWGPSLVGCRKKSESLDRGRQTEYWIG
jgi:hypothetical protein